MKTKIVYITPRNYKAKLDRNWYIQSALMAFILLALVIGAVAVIQKAFPEEPQEPQEQQVEQLAMVTTTQDNNQTIDFVEPEVTPEPIEYYFTYQDLEALAKTLYGECRGCSYFEQCKVAWVVCNRVDHGFGDTVYDVVTANSQFHGYSDNNPVTLEQMEIAQYVLINWSAEKQGYEVERELGPDYLFFFGDGKQNHFRTEWTGG